MHAALLTVMLALGADESIVEYAPEPDMAAAGAAAGIAQRDPIRSDSGVRGMFNDMFSYVPAWFRRMPQTCYSPRFGCYPGNGRDIQRYPAFHGTYYRRAYNYRQLYEYPWHAAPHEPLGFYARSAPEEVVALPEASGMSPAPTNGGKAQPSNTKVDLLKPVPEDMVPADED